MTNFPTSAMLYCGTGWRRYSSAFNSAIITMTKIGSFAYLLVLSLDYFTLAGFAKTAEVGSAVSLEYEVQQSSSTGDAVCTSAGFARFARCEILQ